MPAGQQHAAPQPGLAAEGSPSSYRRPGCWPRPQLPLLCCCSNCTLGQRRGRGPQQSKCSSTRPACQRRRATNRVLLMNPKPCPLQEPGPQIPRLLPRRARRPDGRALGGGPPGRGGGRMAAGRRPALSGPRLAAAGAALAAAPHCRAGGLFGHPGREQLRRHRGGCRGTLNWRPGRRCGHTPALNGARAPVPWLCLLGRAPCCAAKNHTLKFLGHAERGLPLAESSDSKQRNGGAKFGKMVCRGKDRRGIERPIGTSRACQERRARKDWNAASTVWQVAGTESTVARRCICCAGVDRTRQEVVRLRKNGALVAVQGSGPGWLAIVSDEARQGEQ